MRLISLAATPAAFFLPSPSTHINAGKLALLGTVVATFFLFTAGNRFPGGSLAFTDWAEAIVQGTKLNPNFAYREVGVALLQLLAGFPLWHSFIGITLIHASFAVLMPVLVYLSLERASPTVAFYTGLLCIASLAPFTYIKFFFHDQAYMFFALLSVTLLIRYLGSGRFRTLLFFTLAAVATSFTRSVGNLVYPVFMAIAYVVVRAPIRQYLVSILIFLTAVGLNAWHRYEMFDMRNRATAPGGAGMQTLYSTYMYLSDFGYRLTPDMGPNTKLLLDELQKELQPGAREALITRAWSRYSPEYVEKHVYSLTPEQLVEKVSTQTNEDHYGLLAGAVSAGDYHSPSGLDTEDQVLRNVAWEIVRAYPWYVVQYSTRNLWHQLFDPGYASTKFNMLGFGKTGNDFIPGTHGFGDRDEDTAVKYGSRAVRELEYFPLMDKPNIVQRIFNFVEMLYVNGFQTYVWITAVPMVIGWAGAALGLLAQVAPRLRISRSVTSAGLHTLAAPIMAASALLLYESLATALFSQPVYRYFHIMEPLRLVVAGFGIVILLRMLAASRAGGTGSRIA